MVSPENSCWDGKSPRTPLVKEKVYTEEPQGEGGLFTPIGSHCSLNKYKEKEGSASLSLGAEAENEAPSNDPACTRPRGLRLQCPEGGEVWLLSTERTCSPNRTARERSHGPDALSASFPPRVSSG